jgi:SSS family solute:Na+ symporter
MLWRRATATASFVTLVVTLPVAGVGWAIVEIAGFLDIQYLYASGVMFAISVAVMVGVSLVTRPVPPERLGSTVWRLSQWHEDSLALRAVPWYRSWRVQAVILLVLAGAIVVWWW